MSRHTVSKYQIMFYGGKDGYNSCRAQINIHADSGIVGFIRFHDAGRPLAEDAEEGGKIVMHLPLSSFEGVLDVLRNEKPLTFYRMGSSAFLTSEAEMAGVGDR